MYIENVDCKTQRSNSISAFNEYIVSQFQIITEKQEETYYGYNVIFQRKIQYQRRYVDEILASQDAETIPKSLYNNRKKNYNTIVSRYKNTII